MVELLEDRCELPIHSFKAMTDHAIRVCYHIPIAIQPCSYNKQKSPYALEKLKFFTSNTPYMNLVDMVMVIEYSPNPSTSRKPLKVSTSFNKTGAVITAFLRNLPLEPEDIANLTWVTKNVIPWGGDLKIVQKYVNTLGKNGMPGLKGVWYNSLKNFFPIYRTKPTPNRKSRANKVEDRNKKLLKNLNKTIKNRIFMKRVFNPVTGKETSQSLKDVIA